MWLLCLLVFVLIEFSEIPIKFCFELSSFVLLLCLFFCPHPGGLGSRVTDHA